MRGCFPDTTQCPHYLPVVVGNQAPFSCVVIKLDDCGGGVHGQAVMGEQRVQEGAEHTPWWATVLGVSVVEVLLPTLTHWWWPVRKFRI